MKNILLAEKIAKNEFQSILIVISFSDLDVLLPDGISATHNEKT